MAEWILRERDKLLRRDLKATVKANIVVIAILSALLVGLYLAAGEFEVGSVTMTILLMLVVLLTPLISFFLLDRLRTRIWAWSSGQELRRLRAMRYLSNYVELIGKERLEALPAPARERAHKALDKEAAGYLPSEQEYAQALLVLLHVEPDESPSRQRREDGKARRRRS